MEFHTNRRALVWTGVFMRRSPLNDHRPRLWHAACHGGIACITLEVRLRFKREGGLSDHHPSLPRSRPLNPDVAQGADLLKGS